MSTLLTIAGPLMAIIWGQIVAYELASESPTIGADLAGGMALCSALLTVLPQVCP